MISDNYEEILRFAQDKFCRVSRQNLFSFFYRPQTKLESELDNAAKYAKWKAGEIAMIYFLLRWVLLTLCILVTPYLVKGVSVDTVGTAITAAAVLGILNLILKPLLVLFTLPFTILTFGLFLVVINAIVFQLTAFFVSGLEVDSFFSSVLAAIWVSLFSWLANLNVRREDGRTQVYIHKSPNQRSPHSRDVTPK